MGLGVGVREIAREIHYYYYSRFLVLIKFVPNVSCADMRRGANDHYYSCSSVQMAITPHRRVA